jgi:hypothetical protein
MKIEKNGGKTFETCPEYTGPAVCVDVTPLEKRDTQNGPKMQFKVVFEVKAKRSDGKPFAVWSKSFTPSNHEKSNFYKFMKGWSGRVLTDSEWDSFDTEQLLGRAAHLIIINERVGEDVYANINHIQPHKTSDGEPLKPSGTYVRKQDREKQGSSYNRTEPSESPASTPADSMDWTKTKVHVGKNVGHELRELTDESVKSLIANWLPTALAKDKPSADDKRLIAALEEYLAFQNEKDAAKATVAAEDLPY